MQKLLKPLIFKIYYLFSFFQLSFRFFQDSTFYSDPANSLKLFKKIKLFQFLEHNLVTLSLKTQKSKQRNQASNNGMFFCFRLCTLNCFTSRWSFGAIFLMV